MVREIPMLPRLAQCHKQCGKGLQTRSVQKDDEQRFLEAPGWFKDPIATDLVTPPHAPGGEDSGSR